MADSTVEPQYNECLRVATTSGISRLGLMSNFTWHDDPKRLCFLLARYKFVSKMIAGSKSALEIGCADAFATRIVRQAVDSITAVDFDPIFVENANENASHRWPVKVLQHDILRGPVPGEYDAAYSLDVFEHIEESQESLFLSNIIESLTRNGVLIIGSPSLESQAYASEGSKRGHVNCKSGEKLKSTMKAFFHNVFIFSMNDEVVHTGYYPMAHYLLAVCCSPRKNK